MGDNTFTRASYASASKAYVPKTGSGTSRGEERVRNTGKLDPLVDPAEFEVIRRSLVRFNELTAEGPHKGHQLMTIGCSMPIETRLDTTGSMGDNVERALKVLPNLYERCSQVLPGYDVHLATGIFGDCCDRFVLCRPQFEMEASKLVDQLTLMHPEGGGCGNGGEDPHYGIFGGAYLVRAYANQIGLKRYDFTITDEPARYDLRERELIRIFGPEVFDKCKTNGFDINPNDLPSTKEVIQDLLQQAHGFLLKVGNRASTSTFWTEVFGRERVVQLPNIDVLAQVQAIIVGLTEGTLALDQIPDFLAEFKVGASVVDQIQRSVANIPIGAQVPLRQAIIDSGHQIPVAGDIFERKPDVFAGTDLWPIDHIDDPSLVGVGADASGGADIPDGADLDWL